MTLPSSEFDSVGPPPTDELDEVLIDDTELHVPDPVTEKAIGG